MACVRAGALFALVGWLGLCGATKHVERHCIGDDRLDGLEHSYTSLAAAMDACVALGCSCFGVSDENCDHTGSMYLCDGSKIKYSSDLTQGPRSCVFERNRGIVGRILLPPRPILLGLFSVFSDSERLIRRMHTNMCARVFYDGAAITGWTFDTDCKPEQKGACPTKHVKRYCGGSYALDERKHVYQTPKAAKVACLALGSSCFGVSDENCDLRGPIYLCDGSKIKRASGLGNSVRGSCVFEKPQGGACCETNPPTPHPPPSTTYTHTHTHTLSLSLSLIHTHTHTHTRARACKHTPCWVVSFLFAAIPVDLPRKPFFVCMLL